MALRLTYGARGPEPDDPIYVFLNTNSWVLIGLGLAPAVLGGLITVVGGLFGLLAASTFVEAMIQRRAAQRRSMCTMLALLAERGQQLDSSVLLAGQEMRGIAGRAAAKLLRCSARARHCWKPSQPIRAHCRPRRSPTWRQDKRPHRRPPRCASSAALSIVNWHPCGGHVSIAFPIWRSFS